MAGGLTQVLWPAIVSCHIWGRRHSSGCRRFTFLATGYYFAFFPLGIYKGYCQFQHCSTVFGKLSSCPQCVWQRWWLTGLCQLHNAGYKWANNGCRPARKQRLYIAIRILGNDTLRCLSSNYLQAIVKRPWKNTHGDAKEPILKLVQGGP